MANRVYETAIRIAATIDKAFKPELLSAASAVAKLSKEAKGLKAAEALTERLAKQQHAVAVAAEKVAAGEKGAEKELKRAQAAADRTGNSLRKMGVDTSRLASEQRRLGAELATTEARMKRAEAINAHFGKTLEKLSEGAKKWTTIEGSAGKVRDAAGGLVKDALKIAGLGVAAGAGMFELAKSTAEAGHEIETTSVRLGTTAEALQLVRSAGKKTGADVEALDTGLGKLAINLGKILSLKKKGGSGLVGNVGEIQILGTGTPGSAKPADPFAHIGLSAKKLAQLAPEQQVAQIADAFGKLKTHSEKAAAAVAIFGKGGLAMLPLLAKGGKGLEEFYAAARASGNVLSKETIENAQKFHLAYLAAQGQITGVKNTLGAALLPAVTRVLGQFNEWLSKNRGQVKIWADQLAAWLENKAIPAIEKLIPQIMQVARQVGGWIEKGTALIGGIGNLGTALAAIRLAPFGVSVASLAVNFARLALQIGAAETAAIGFKAAQVGLVAAAGAAGYAVGSFIDEQLGISDYLSGTANNQVGISKSDSSLAKEANARFEADMAAYRARRAASPRTGTSTAPSSTQVTYAPQITIQGNASREDIDAAHRKAQEDFAAKMKAHEAEQRRLAYE